MRTVLLACAFLMCAGSVLSDNSPAVSPRVVLVLASSTSIKDIADPSLPNLSRLIRNGSIALVNVRTGKPTKDTELLPKPGMEAGCVSLGAGAMAAGGAEVERAWNADAVVSGARTSDIYRCRTARNPANAEVLHIEIAKMRRINESAQYHAKPGLLGSTLRAAGIRTAVIGNSDLPDRQHREAVTIAMDENGEVDFGDVSSQNLLEQDASSPYGLRSNIDTYLQGLKIVLPKSGFVVVDFGDTYRADDLTESSTDSQVAVLRHAAMVRLDEFICKLEKLLNFRKDTLIIASVNPRSATDIDEDTLASIVMKGPQYGSGMLWSPSTRKNGLVTISDIAPSVLAVFHIQPPKDMIGRPIKYVPRKNASSILLKTDADAGAQAQRQVIMRGGSVAQSVVVVLVTLVMLACSAGALKRVAVWVALVPAALIPAMLYLPLIYNGGLAGSAIVLVVLTSAIIGLCAVVVRKPMKALFWLSAIIVASLIVDLVRGAPLITASIAGYNISEGARFYGIGNELMGTMLGATIVGMGLLLSSGRINGTLRAISTATVFAGVFACIGMSNLGANVGGAMASVPAMAAMLLMRRAWHFSLKRAGLIAGLTVCVIGGLFALDAVRSGGAQSHAGRIVDMAAGGEFVEVLGVLERKILLNFMLVSTSLWSRLLGLSLVASAIIHWRNRLKLGACYLGHELSASVAACVVAVAGAFAFNDSGVVAAATCVVYLWMVLVLSIETNKAGGSA